MISIGPLWGLRGLTVDPDGTGVNLVGGHQRPRDIPREHGTRQPEFSIVGHLDDFFIRRKLDQDDDGTENFLFDDLHIGSSIGKDGRLDKVSGITVSPASEFTGCSLGFSGIDVAHDSLERC
jgi:hypothetical protein